MLNALDQLVNLDEGVLTVLVTLFSPMDSAIDFLLLVLEFCLPKGLALIETGNCLVAFKYGLLNL